MRTSYIMFDLECSKCSHSFLKLLKKLDDGYESCRCPKCGFEVKKEEKVKEKTPALLYASSKIDKGNQKMRDWVDRQRSFKNKR